MKKTLIFVFLFSFLACEKNDPKPLSEKYTTQEIYKAIMGTWRPSRLAYDENFKNIEYVETDTCAFKYNVAFNSDGTGYSYIGCSGEFSTGTYAVNIGGRYEGDNMVHVLLLGEWGIFLSKNVEQAGGVTLHSFTDSTLVFSEASYNKGGKTLNDMYSEFKRVKE